MLCAAALESSPAPFLSGGVGTARRCPSAGGAVTDGAGGAAETRAHGATASPHRQATPASAIELRRKRDDKGAALPRRGLPDENPPSVIFLDDALGQRETEPPSPGLGREAGVERAGLFLRAHAAAVVDDRDLDRLVLGAALEAHLDVAGAPLDRVYGVDRV